MSANRAWAEPVTASSPRPDSVATLASWLLYVPWGSPAWKHYLVSIISLEDIEGVPPAVKNYPAAEYEIMVVALDPKYHPNPTDASTLRPLTPINYQEQFHDVPREKIAGLCEVFAMAFIHGDLLIEPTGIQGARWQFRGSLDKTLEHLRSGKHG